MSPSTTTGAGPNQERPSPVTRVAFALTLALLAVILVVAAAAAPETADSRIGRRVELVELIRAEQARADELSAEVEALSAQVASYQRDDGDGDAVAALQARIDELAVPAGMTALRGPGVTVTLSDSTLQPAAGGDLNDLVIHEQDLQAVINALWAGGAEAMSVNGQRILATTAIRCVGNTLLLHGAVYSPPYVIDAIGNPDALQRTIDTDPAVQTFRSAVQRFELGFTVTDGDIEVPGYDGLSAMREATPAVDGG